MATAEIVQLQTKQESAFVCTSCGADRDCDCNAPGRKRKIILDYLQKHPDASTRTASADLGVSNSTVSEVRNSGVRHRTPELVTGRDGKQYPATKASLDKGKDADASAAALASFRAACNQLLPKLNDSDMRDAIDYFRGKSGYF